MRILIIGGTRFIGPRVARRLHAAGHAVTVAHRGEHAASLPSGIAEIRDTALGAPIVRVPDALRRVEPEVVIHMMAMGEADAIAAVRSFEGIARRIVAPSSGDVYRAYGLFARLEEGPLVPTPLTEESPLRESRFPYRRADTPPDAMEFWYEKILVEAALRSSVSLACTILRLPKVYGPEENADLATVHAFRHVPHWRWTHGHVDDVAKAIALAAVDERAAGRTYNVGERYTPTVGERLAVLGARPDIPTAVTDYRFDQDVHYDTSRIRDEVGYREDAEVTGTHGPRD